MGVPERFLFWVVGRVMIPLVRVEMEIEGKDIRRMRERSCEIALGLALG